jgi:formate/nitrite transporter FocA (FNT family)
MRTPCFLFHQGMAKLTADNQDQPLVKLRLLKSMGFSHALDYVLKGLEQLFTAKMALISLNKTLQSLTIQSMKRIFGLPDV